MNGGSLRHTETKQSRQRKPSFRQQFRKRLAGEEGIFLLAHGGKMVEAYEARHRRSRDGTSPRRRRAGHRGTRRTRRRSSIGARNCRRRQSPDWSARRPRRCGSAHAPAEHVEEMRLGVAAALEEWRGAPALPNPRRGRALLHHCEQCVADLRQEMHVLVPIDEIRQPSERTRGTPRSGAPPRSPQRGHRACAKARAPASAAATESFRRPRPDETRSSGRNGAVRVKCRPIAARPAAASASASASAFAKLGAPTITEVALRRPRAMRSRMARFTAGEMP